MKPNMANNPRVTELNDQIKVYDEALARLTAMRLELFKERKSYFDADGYSEVQPRLARR